MKNISVSERTYTRLQRLAKPFEDSPEDVIIALLNQRDESSSESSNGDLPQRKSDGPTKSQGGDLVSTGGRVPHGTRLKAVYKGTEYLAEVQDGRVLWKGKQYTSLSAAAIAVIQSTGSDRPTEDGWRFWEFWNEKASKWESRADPKDRAS